MRVIYFLAAALLSLTAAQAQDRFGQIQNLIPRDKTGINQFDVKKDTVIQRLKYRFRSCSCFAISSDKLL